MLRTVGTWSALVLLVILCVPAQIFAETPSTPKISVAPFLQNVEINNEATKNFEITYTNDSSQDKALVLSVVDFGSLDQTGGVAFAGSGFNKLLSKYSLSKWLVLSENSFNLKPHQAKTVTAIVTNSSDLTPGGHYASVVATVLSSDNNSNNKVNLKQQISSLVFAVKTGGEKYDIKLQNIDSDKGLFRLPSESQITIKAIGNTHVVPRGVVYLKNSSGKVVAKGIINPESGIVLPDTTRVFAVELKRLYQPKLYQHSFYLQVDYRYDGINQFASKKQSVSYINPWIIASILAIVLIIIVILKKLSISTQKKSQ